MCYMRLFIVLFFVGLMMLLVCGEDVVVKDDLVVGLLVVGGSNNSVLVKDGGLIIVCGCILQNLFILFNINEICGGNVFDVVIVCFIYYNFDIVKLEMDIVQFIEIKDNQNFIVKIKLGYKFFDGIKVKVQNFVVGWNWVVYGFNVQQFGYFFELIEGYVDEQCGDEVCKIKFKVKIMSGFKVVDDYIFIIKIIEKVFNFKVCLGYIVFVLLLDVFFKDLINKKWEKMLIGVGLYKVIDNIVIVIIVVKNENYVGVY